ncbi:MAG TPA: hypothetical protein VGS04_05125 [Nitrososphaerales archaeon]|nr:hypothetical protein [Nitrososphaerales archaeon]
MFGKQVEFFLKSDIGSYLVKRADKERAEALEELVTVDASDHAKVSAIQLRARVAGSVIDWLAEAIRDGESATEMLKEDQ